ncbi:hypothetical protein Tamer19_51070 [Cupriavidus sp. TA19]|uniref:Bug family tripartite tricarboxylate transporter substrate binding protein n=1 Tax=unclassified Cupriavidus TaxID=2640874 RepID=UPI000E2E7AE4|nr:MULTISPECIES: tripartite tricarboxylate transporter substrate binding protein [unclassified Cupriavidus]BDB30662.1 tripartite tricarboxylate transporter substrate binding protein [Cupriavidus sp. P-10]GLC95698.1 hypothetical protein Tamer19_51070 [Cupriavidus sp. TA19]
MKHIKSCIRALIGAMAMTCAIASGTSAAAEFPQKGSTITLLVPYGPGGQIDVMGRAMAAYWDAKWGTRTIVLNKVGANNQIALSELLRRPADGHTIAFAQGFEAQLTYLNPEANAPYSRSNFVPVALSQRTPAGWVVRADSPYQTMTDLVKAAQAKPGTVTLGTPTSRGPAQLYIEEFDKKQKAKLNSVPFNDGPSMMNALLGGHIDIAVTNPTIALPHLKSGRIRAIMVSGNTPSKFFPSVPTAGSLGLDISSFGASTGLTLARGTPAPVVQAWSTMLKELSEDADMRAKMDAMGIQPEYAGPSDYAALWDAMQVEVTKLLMRTQGKVRPIQ